MIDDKFAMQPAEGVLDPLSDNIDLFYNTSPPRLGGDMFANCFALNHVCQLCLRMAEYAIFIGGMFARFGGHPKSTNTRSQENMFFSIFLQISFGLPGPLWTAFRLKLI